MQIMLDLAARQQQQQQILVLSDNAFSINKSQWKQKPVIIMKGALIFGRKTEGGN